MSRLTVSPDLLVGLRSRDARAQEAFVRALTPGLIGLARIKGFSQADAEEIAQETLAAALAQLGEGRFEGRSQLSSWVHAIFKHRAADRRRSNARRQLAEVPLDGPSGSGRPWSQVLTPEVDNGTVLRVQNALAQLTPEQRVVLLMNVHEGHAARDIARIFQMGQKTVEARVTEAKKAFRQAYLSQQEGGLKDSRAARRLK